MVFLPVAAHHADILIGILHQRQPAVPCAHAGAGILGSAHLGQRADFILALIGQISPVQADGLLGQAGIGFRMAIDDIAPEHRGDPALDQMPAQRGHMADIHLVLALLLHQRSAAALAQIEGFIAADVELAGGKQRRVLIDQAGDKRQRARIVRAQGMMIAGIGIVEGFLFGIRQLAQLAAGSGAQNLIHMAEA